MSVAQYNWVFLGSSVSKSGDTGLSVPPAVGLINQSFSYYDLLTVWFRIKPATSDTLYFFHDLNVLGTSYNTRIWNYTAASVTPSQTNTTSGPYMILTQAATVDTCHGVMFINNIGRPTTNERTIKATINHLANGGVSIPAIEIAQGSTNIGSPMTRLSINTLGGASLATGSYMSVFGCNII